MPTSSPSHPPQQVSTLLDDGRDLSARTSASNPSTSTSIKRPDEGPCCPKTGRNLVVCIDGTANQFSEKNTNVVELYSRVIKDDNQLAYYNSGIGTYVKPSLASFSFWKQFFNHTIDMAIAWNFQRIVLSAYLWLSENYRPGDRIFLFGFSRGAYQVRVIAGMIEKVGLLHKGNNEQIGFAYELYSAITKDGKRSSSKGKGAGTPATNGDDPAEESKAEKLCRAFKEALCRPEVKVHFVGAWDTVSSIGVTRGPSLPETVTGMIHVCHFRHALALDERRVKFLPEYANGGAGPGNKKLGDVKEVWFPGSHSDIGGGTVPNMRLDQFGPALRWMTYEAISHGLKMAPYRGEWAPLTPTNSLTPIWKAFEIWPFRRLSYKGKDKTTHRPHLGKARVIQSHQLVHRSVFEEMAKGYIPNARMYDDTVLTAKVDESLKEGDPYASANDILLALRDDTTDDALIARVDALDLLTSSFGYQPLTEQPKALETIISVLTEQCQTKKAGKSSPTRRRLVDLLIEALATFLSMPRHANRYPYSKFQALKSDIEDQYPHHSQAVSKAIIYLSLSHLIRCFDIHKSYVRSVRYHIDGKRILSAAGSSSGWSLWEADTGSVDVEGSYEGCSSSVGCAAFSQDGSRVAAGLKDGSVLVWDIGANKTPTAFEGHLSQVNGVAFSYDGQYLATCSEDGRVRISSLTDHKITGQLLVRRDSSRPLLCVAFSADGTLVAAGARDKAICIWATRTGELLRELQGHDSRVLSISFSPDGSRILSSSKDFTVCVWGASSECDPITILRGHTNLVPAVAWSPDGNHIASGSFDETVRLWDSKTGKAVRVFDAGSVVTAVAFSPDGCRLVSATRWGTVHVWDTETPSIGGAGES